MAIFLLAYVATFSGQLCFRRRYFFTTVTFSEHLLFFGELLFQNSQFLLGVIFSEQPLFEREPSTDQHHLRIGSSLGQFLFGTAALLAMELLRMKISTELLLSKQVLLHTISYFRRATFWKRANFSEKQYSALPIFSGQLLFRAATFLKDVVFYGSCFFRRVTFLPHTFLEELKFHSCASFPQLHFLFISY